MTSNLGTYVLLYKCTQFNIEFNGYTNYDSVVAITTWLLPSGRE